MLDTRMNRNHRQASKMHNMRTPTEGFFHGDVVLVVRMLCLFVLLVVSYYSTSSTSGSSAKMLSCLKKKCFMLCFENKMFFIMFSKYNFFFLGGKRARRAAVRGRLGGVLRRLVPRPSAQV